MRGVQGQSATIHVMIGRVRMSTKKAPPNRATLPMRNRVSRQRKACRCYVRHNGSGERMKRYFTSRRPPTPGCMRPVIALEGVYHPCSFERLPQSNRRICALVGAFLVGRPAARSHCTAHAGGHQRSPKPPVDRDVGSRADGRGDGTGRRTRTRDADGHA